MLNDIIKQQVMTQISTNHQNAITKANKNINFVRADKNYLDLDKACRLLVLKIAQEKNCGNNCIELENEFRKTREKRASVVSNLGFKTEDLAPKYTCTLCGDTGLYNGSYCKCFLKLYNEKLMKLSGIDFDKIPFLKEYDFSKFENDNLINIKKIVNVADVYVNNFASLKIRNMLISGSVGVGKSYLAKIIAKEVFNKNFSVLFISAFSLCNNFLTCEFNAQEKAKYMESLVNVDLLIIDDLGAQTLNKFSLQDLLALINERIENNKNTIITTNLSPVDLKNNMGERVFSRLNDKREFFVTNIKGKDLRLN